MTAETTTAVLQATAARLPPVVVDPHDRLSIADSPGRTFAGLQARLDQAAGPLPRASAAGLPALAHTARPVAENARLFANTETPLAAASWGRPVEKLAWNPITGALFFVHPPQHHATALAGQRFHDHVRLILLHSEHRLCIRPCVPEWLGGGPTLDLTPAQAWASTVLQLAARAALLRTPGGERWITELNTNNRRLEQRTGRRGW